ncbi:DUF1926 domain-containing protein, partial [Candidatus Desantisbacteria bacterium]|nr:DUF1926 domain-containing protein [Candidatus Desantisbacteria bacterium]
IFEHLINAEQIIDKYIYNNDKNYLEIKEIDLDGDGLNEIIVNTPLVNFYLSPHRGGCVFELDFKPCLFNLLDTLKRRKEFYHKKIQQQQTQFKYDNEGTKSIHEIFNSKEAGLEKYLNYDWYEHKYLLDHFLEEDSTLENFRQGVYKERGNFVTEPYVCDIKNTQNFLMVLFKKDGDVLCKGQNSGE